MLLACVEERAECLGIARQWTHRVAGGRCDAAVDGFERAIEPDRNAVATQQVAVGVLREGPAAEREDGGASAFDPSYVLLNDRGFDAAERGLSARFENFGDGHLFGCFDLGIGVEEVPSHAARQVPAHGALSRRHEADEVQSGRAFQTEVHALSLSSARRPSKIEGEKARRGYEETIRRAAPEWSARRAPHRGESPWRIPVR